MIGVKCLDETPRLRFGLRRPGRRFPLACFYSKSACRAGASVEADVPSAAKRIHAEIKPRSNRFFKMTPKSTLEPGCGQGLGVRFSMSCLPMGVLVMKDSGRNQTNQTDKIKSTLDLGCETGGPGTHLRAFRPIFILLSQY